MVCTCKHYAPALRVLRSSEFNSNLARFYKEQGLSGDRGIDWVLTELYEHRTGRLFGPCGPEIQVDTKSDVFDRAFSEDSRRWMNRFLEKATHPPKGRLHIRCIPGTIALHLARQAFRCRTEGPCSH